MGLHPDEIGRFAYPDFVRYLDYYTDPQKFVVGYMDREDAADKLQTYHKVQQALIRKAEAEKEQDKLLNDD